MSCQAGVADWRPLLLGMAFLVDEAYLPAILTVGPMTDEAFAQLCTEHPDLNLELMVLPYLIT